MTIVGTVAPGVELPPTTPRRSWGLRIIPQWDKNSKLVEQAASRDGKLALLGLFGLLLFLALPRPVWAWTMMVLLCTSLLPHLRWILVTAGTVGMAVLTGYVNYGHTASEAFAISPRVLYGISITAVLLFGLLLVKMAAKWPRSRMMRRPVLSLNLFFVGLALAAAVIPLSRTLQQVVQFTVALLAGYLWYFAYSLQDRLAPDRNNSLLQLGTWNPFWVNATGAGVPFCRGAAYLRRVEAKTPQELAITQLKGVKLIMWCTILRIATVLFARIAYGSSWGLALPDLEGLIQTGRLPAWYLCWATLIANFVLTVLSMAAWGNTIVACCRMAGFRALRNTYRPFEAVSIADFWNRYYYYFKELLVDFFFYPTYTRYFKRHRRLRMFTATLVAAAFGNMIYHFFRDIDVVFQVGPLKAVAGFQVYAFYCMVLGCGIGISQMLERRSPSRETLWSRILPAARIIAFFCLLHIFDYTGRDHSVMQHVRFLLHLFNLG